MPTVGEQQEFTRQSLRQFRMQMERYQKICAAGVELGSSRVPFAQSRIASQTWVSTSRKRKRVRRAH